MSLKDRILDDMKAAMKAKDALRLGVLRMTKAKFIEFETSGRNETLDDNAVITLLKNLIKQRRESAKVFRDNGRSELADQEEAEIGVLEGYLPAGVPEDVVRGIVAEEVARSGAAGPKEMGKVMGPVMARLKTAGGLVDGALVQRLVKEALGG